MKHAAEQELKEISKSPKSVQPLALAGLLTKYFEKQKVLLTVVGGASVQYYTEGAYETGDLDAILEDDTRDIIENVMGELGFKRTTNYRHFEHPLFPFVVEFPPEPIEVGNRQINQVNLLTFNDLKVRVIRLEDIIMDRIIAGAEWKDEQSILQAKLLYYKNMKIIDKPYLEQFAKEEGYVKQLQSVMTAAEEQWKKVLIKS